MSVTVRAIYNQVCFVCLEDFGFVLGIYSEAQFLHALSVVLLDFNQRAPLDKTIFTTQINAGDGDYAAPDDIMALQLCFVGGKLIEKVAEADLTQGHLAWQRQTGMPRQWHEDNLEIKHLALFPTPDFNGAMIPGDGPVIGKYGNFYPTERNLTIIGTAAPSKTVWTLDDTLDGIPDSFAYYLVYGILEQIFSDESENKDLQRALYCRARYEEAISIAAALAREELLEDDEDA